jgi:4-carboxymuconolactone decarboxylase
MKSHGRLPWPAPEELDEPARSLYDRIAGGPRAAGPQAFALTDANGRLNGPFNAMLVSPDVGSALQELGSAIRYKTQFPARVREIAILELARLRRSEFEWYAHARVGAQAGLTDVELAALHDGTPAPTLSEPEALTRDVVRSLVVEGELDDAAFAAAVETLGLRDLVDLITLVGYYESLALMLRTLRTPLPDGEAPVFP